MAAPVWVLSVDLQTKTASFTTGLADAAQKARGAFADIKSSAKEGGEAISKSSINAQQALGVLTNALRGDTENAFADIIREMSHTSVVMAALPFAAAAGGALLLVNTAVEVAQKIKEWREEQEKLVNEQTRFGTTINETFGSLDDRLLQAQQRADELRNDHLGALQKQLELIDRASMRDLVHEFETLSKAAEGTFKLLESHWYNFGSGSAGAQQALEKFKLQYDSLLAQGKDGQAGDLLKGTRESAERTLAVMESLNNIQKSKGLFGGVDFSSPANALAALYANRLQGDQKSLESQKAIVEALRAQETVQSKLQAIKNQDSSNAKTTVGNDANAQRSAAAAQAAQSQMAIQEQLLAADKAYADAALTMQQATVEKRLASDLDFAQRDYAIKLQGNAAEIAALNKSGKDYENQLKALQEKRLELDAQHDAALAGLRSRADVEQYQRDLANLQQSEREKIQAAQQGSAERLAAIDAALKEAQVRGQQDTDYYRQLNSQRVDTVRQAAQDEAKFKADAGREAADNTLRMGELQLQAEQQQMELANSSRHVSDQERVAQALAVSEIEYQLKRQALQDAAAALDTGAKDYENRLRAVQDRELQLLKEHENEKTDIQNHATMARNQQILGAQTQFEQSIARSTASVLLGQQSFASMMSSIGGQVASGMIQNAMLAIMANDMTKPSDAAKAAREAFGWGWEHGGPAAPVLAPLLGAGAFTAVMAFARGGIVPGSGNFDSVPAMLMPGESVLPKAMTEKLSRADSGGGPSGPTYHINVKPTYHLQALDGAGIERTLKNHTATLTKHFNQQVRRMNK